MCIHAHGACMLCVHIYVHEVCVVWMVLVVWACVCCVVCGVHVHMDVCMACIVHIPIGGVLSCVRSVVCSVHGVSCVCVVCPVYWFECECAYMSKGIMEKLFGGGRG